MNETRRPRPTDAAAVTDIYNAYDRAFGLESADTVEDMLDWWRELELVEDAWVVERDDRVVAFGCAEPPRDGTASVDACIELGVATDADLAALFRLVEQRAAERGARRAETTIAAGDETGARVLEQMGFRVARHYVRMRIDLKEQPPAPAWPEGVRPVGFDPARDAEAFHAATTDAFADEWSHRPESFERWRERRLEAASFDPALWFAVREGDQIAAILVCEAQRFGLPWITQLGVRRPWRRRGLGLALLHHAFGEFWRRGERAVGLGVDTASPTGATRLYERAGMRVDASWTFFEKELTLA
jgi:mycothiol synthase